MSDIELRGLAELGVPIVRTLMEAEAPIHVPQFTNADDEKKWWAEQEAEEQKQLEELKRRREEAQNAFRRELLQRLEAAYEAGAQRAVSAEARRAVTVRGYVLLGVVAAVVSMPVIGMLLDLDPDTFGAFIAPVTGIAGTIVGYWFGTVGQVPGQGTTQPPERRDREEG